MPVPRVAVVGTGMVGATTAYALLVSGSAPEIVLVDKDSRLAEGQAADLGDAELFTHHARIIVGDFAACATADVIIITAGVHQTTSMRSRLDDLRTSAGIVREIVGEIMRHDPSGVFVVASNPVDVLTYATLKWSGLPAHRVLGSGTTLDTSRFRRRLAARYGVSADNVHAYIIGEHGDSQVPVLSSARIAGMELENFCRAMGIAHDPDALMVIARETRIAGFEILQAKGATYFGIGAALVRIAGAILRDEHAVLTVSSLAPAAMGLGDVCLSLPAIVNRTGVARILPTPLSPTERAGLERSAETLARYNASLETVATT